jgi:hypothetical protein
MKDTWDKPRGHGQHLTEAEIAEIKEAYCAGQKIGFVARKLKCSSRVVSKYYGLFRAEGVTKRVRRPVATNRFYKSDFNL